MRARRPWGKTTAALEYAYRHLDEYALVWMFRAAEATALLAQFHELAERLDPTGIGERADRSPACTPPSPGSAGAGC
ncbi:hypothetical protein GCM10020218_093010 [Dactylosporangium vinaceum]